MVAKCAETEWKLLRWPCFIKIFRADWTDCGKQKRILKPILHPRITTSVTCCTKRLYVRYVDENNCSSVVNNPPEFTGARPSPSSTLRQHGKAKTGAPTTQTKLLWFIGLKQGRATIRSIHEWTCGLCPKKNEKRTDYTYRGLDGWSERVTPSLWWLPSKLASGVVMAWLIGSRTTDGTIWWVYRNWRYGAIVRYERFAGPNRN